MFAVASMNPMIGWILLGYFLLAGNIAAEKWLLASYDFKEINFITAAVIMGLTAFQEFAQHRSFERLKPVHWPSLLLLSFCTLVAWNCYLYSLLGLSLFEFGAIGLLSPVVMACLAIPILRERPSRWLWFALLLGLTGGFFLVKGDWNGLGEWHYHAVMFLALVFASLRWILVKNFGDRILLPALIFWEPLLVLITTGLIIDLSTLWDKATLGLFSAALLLFLSRQCLVRSYQSKQTKATSISSLVYTKLGWAMLFGFLIWGTVPSWLEWLGIGLIILSSWLIARRSS
jgi:drug/metabolite transporter (DMT)-like permease